MTQLGILRNNSSLGETDSTSFFSSLRPGMGGLSFNSTPVGTELRKRGQIEPGPISTSYIPAKATPPARTSLSGSSGSQSRKSEFPADEFSDLSLKTFALQKKCRDVYSDNERLGQEVVQLEEDKQALRLREQKLEQNLKIQNERNKTATSQLKEIKEKLTEAEEKLKTKEEELTAKDKRINQLERRNKRLEELMKTMQSNLDEYYRSDDDEQENMEWFSGHSISICRGKLPKVTMRFLVEYLAEFAPFWEELGMALDMENAIRAEQTQPITAKQKCLHVLEQWTTRASASYPALLDALLKLNQRPLAVKIERNILKEISDSDSEEEEDGSKAGDSDSEEDGSKVSDSDSIRRRRWFKAEESDSDYYL